MRVYNFVSRGGLKLQEAIDKFDLNIKNKSVLDIGSSTGGFVDCLLQNGAAKVYALDTAYGELSWKLRNNPKVIVLERTNILYYDLLPNVVDLITIDAGWTKLELILAKVKKFLKKNGIIIALLKPQYEVDRSILLKGVVPEEYLELLVPKLISKFTSLGFSLPKVIESPILGGSGNKEYLLLFINE